MPLLETYFGRIPRGKAEPPDVVTLEVKQNAEKRMVAEAEANPRVEMVWKTVPFGHRDSYALNILSQILSTRTGRLYKGLVLGSEKATEADAGVDHRKWAGLFGIDAEAREGYTPEDVERAIYAELDKLKQDEVPADELQKVKNNFAAAEYRGLASNMSILMRLIRADGLGDWKEFTNAGAKHQAVTAADVKRVVEEYLTKEGPSVAIYTRKPEKSGSEAAAPELASLSPEQRKAYDRAAARIKQEKDAARLKTILASMEAAEGKADEKMKSFFELQKKLIQKRLEELKSF